MFKLITSVFNNDTSCKAEYNGREIEFPIYSIIPKRNKSEVNEETQFVLLNAYLDYKGDSFKEHLMSLLEKANEDVMSYIRVEGISPLPVHIVHPILDFLDIDDIFYFLKSVYHLHIPPELSETFDETIETDAREIGRAHV